ncbi:arylalkylamine N-acetyltransferase 1-like [Mya arenaria]|uniref:arylalkylamine N-acetyltransferase 1-like n=1 Tax=Mya arenaria TaxID=6604 RepID=UPI0022E6A043|nr:arylalkylamine N-acetyltransferase 1-like [Mya arenaria]
MGICDKITLEVAQKTLDTIRESLDTKEFRFEIITPEKYEEAYDVMGNNFVPDEPISKSIGVVWDEDFEKLTYMNLIDNISLAAISRETNEMMGVRISGFWRKSDGLTDLSWMKEGGGTKNLFTFITHREAELDFFNRYNVEEAFHFFCLSVRENYRHHHVGEHLLQGATEFAKALGFPAVKGEGPYSQRIYEHSGFQIAMTLPYDTYFVNGRAIAEGTGDIKMTKVYVKKF